MALTDLRIAEDMLACLVEQADTASTYDTLFELGRVYQKLHEAEMMLDPGAGPETVRHEAGRLSE